MNREEKYRLNRTVSEVVLITLAYPIFSEIVFRAADFLLGAFVPGADFRGGIGLSPTGHALLQFVCISVPLAMAVLAGCTLKGKAKPVHRTSVSLFRLLPPFLAVFLALTFLCSTLFGMLIPGGKEPEMLPESGAALLITLVNMTVVPAVGEELLFRGLVQSRLRRWGCGTAIMGQAFLFAVLHGEPAQMLVALVSGWMLGLLMELTGKITLGMILHCANNAIGFLELYSSQYGDGNLLAAIVLFVNVVAAVSAVVSLLWLRHAEWTKKLNGVELFGQKNVLLQVPLYPAAVALIAVIRLVIP